MHPNYLEPHEETRLISESSAIGDYRDSLRCPGSSFQWVGENHHLNREEVKELVGRMQEWLKKKRLRKDKRGRK
jgi:hypothetical protein